MNILSTPQVKIKYVNTLFFKYSYFKLDYLGLFQDFLLGVIKKILSTPKQNCYEFKITEFNFA